ncbi:MAG: hypothetical protein GY853_15215 [PVC group bacterium]|nr:hypothetical protein [PVC group bacterium]
MYKRAQAAMEFLMTYGWAILVVLVVIGALAYFGVLSPQNLLPEKCELQMGLNCKDYIISQGGAASDGTITVNLENGMGQGILITAMTATGKGDMAGVICDEDYCDNDGSCIDAGDPWAWIPGKEGIHMNSGEDSDSAILAQTGAAGSIVLDCDIAGLGTVGLDQSWVNIGKKKFDIELSWYADDSTPSYTHTMKGSLMAEIEA